MAAKKKNKPVRRKKTKIQPKVPDGPAELAGWKVGDITWSVPFGQKVPRQLEIRRLNHKDSEPSLSCVDLVMQRHCVVAVSWCADNKTKAKALYLARNKA